MGAFVLIAALFHAGCGGLPAKAEFENQTSYTITVTIAGSSFDIWNESAQEYQSSSDASFYVYSNGNVKIQSREDTIDFKWTTSTAAANRIIYVVNKGDKVTFKE
jgi:hypothetical protein